MAVLLIAMTGRRVIVETKNESAITGKLVHSDGYGNLYLSNANMTTIRGNKIKFDEIHIKASSIRYVHLPDDVDPLQAMKAELERKPFARKSQMPRKYKKT